MGSVIIYGGCWQNASSNRFADGTAYFALSQDASVSGSAQVSDQEVSFALDSTGSIPLSANAKLWTNDALTPSGTVYAVRVEDVTGNQIWGPQNFSIVGAGPINLATFSPASALVSYPGVVLLNPGGNQTIEGYDLLPAAGNTTQSLGTASAPWVIFGTTGSFATAGLFNVDNTATLPLVSNVNEINFETELVDAQGSHGITSAVSGGIAAPAATGSPVEIAAGLAGFANNSSSGSVGVGTAAVGVYGQSRALVNGAHVWGTNVVACDTPGLTNNVSFYGAEVDVEPRNGSSAYAQIYGVAAIMNGLTNTTYSQAVAFAAQSGNTGSQFQQGFITQNGACVTGMLIGATATSGTCGSQPITFTAFSSGTPVSASIAIDSSGNLDITLPSNQAVIMPSLSVIGKIGAYNGAVTQGNGVPSEVFQVLATAQAANYNSGSPQTLFTPAVVGMWRVSAAQYLTQAATNSSTFPSLTLAWTDPAGIARTATLAGTSTANSTTTTQTNSVTILTNNSTAVTIVSASYASSGATPMQYALAVTAEAL